MTVKVSCVLIPKPNRNKFFLPPAPLQDQIEGKGKPARWTKHPSSKNMLTAEFSEMCFQYEGFQVWEVENIDAFFKGNEILAKIFHDHYSIPYDELKERRSEIQDTDYQIITKLLGKVDDKYFFIFTLHDESHMELVRMQRAKVMDFGINIEEIRGDRVYVMIMDKIAK